MRPYNIKIIKALLVPAIWFIIVFAITWTILDGMSRTPQNVFTQTYEDDCHATKTGQYINFKETIK